MGFFFQTENVNSACLKCLLHHKLNDKKTGGDTQPCSGFIKQPGRSQHTSRILVLVSGNKKSTQEHSVSKYKARLEALKLAVP